MDDSHVFWAYSEHEDTDFVALKQLQIGSSRILIEGDFWGTIQGHEKR